MICNSSIAHNCRQYRSYRMVREHQLMNGEVSQKLRLSFAMQYANELW
ncbi:MAG: hypothetical protein P8X74_24220 [Reinekea sp.]